MGESAEMIMNSVFCEGCGAFITAEPIDDSQKCADCFEDDLIEAVEKNEWPDGINFMDWQEIKRKYSEPEIRE